MMYKICTLEKWQYACVYGMEHLYIIIIHIILFYILFYTYILKLSIFITF